MKHFTSHPKRFRKGGGGTTFWPTVIAGFAGFMSLVATVSGQSAKPFPIPEDVMGPSWLEARRELQLLGSESLSVFHDFRFEDRREASGITFINRVVDDAAKHHKAVHYDHGNGVAVADVDGDGRTDLYFTTQLGGNELWRNVGGGKFEEMTTPALALAEKVSVTASFADTDNDGDPDLLVTTVNQGNHFFRNEGGGKFRDWTEEAGLGHRGHSSGGVFFDYDRDGLLDLFLCNVGVYTRDDKRGRGGYAVGVDDAFAGHLKPDERNERSLLYRNQGDNRFEEVSEEMGLMDERWTGDATPLDGNGDGWMDLYVLNMQGHDGYYENVGGKGFRDRSREVFPRTSWGAMGAKVIDFDNDGRMDLFVTDMHSDMSQLQEPHGEKRKSDMIWPESLLQSGGRSIYGNTFFRALGSGAFAEISDAIGAETYWPWGLSAGDLNADGWEDVVVTGSMNYPFRYGINSVLLNDAGQRFHDSEFLLGVEPRAGGRTAKPWFVLDPGGEDAAHPLVEEHGFTAPVEVWGAVGSRSSAIFDIDGDGDLDVVTNEFHDRPQVLLSTLAAGKGAGLARLEIVLEGTRSNRDGLGAVVRVRVGERWQTRVHDGVTGYLSHGVLPLYFGLGVAETVEYVEVNWPSGIVQRVEGPVAPGRLRVVEEGEVPVGR